MPWHAEEGAGDCSGDTPWAVVKDDTGEVEGCHATEEEAQAQVAALYASEEGDATTMSPTTAAWEGTLVVEGVATGDGREFAPDSLTWGDLPMPLRWLKESTHGGMQVNGVVNVGRIDSVRREGNALIGTGVIDLGQEDGREAARQMGTRDNPGFLSGVSIDADDPDRAEVEYVWAEGCADGDLEEVSMEDLDKCMFPEKMIFHSGRVRAATLCDIPAFVEAQLYLVSEVTDEDIADDDDEPADGVPMEPASLSVADVVEALTAAAHTITIEDCPPAEWFMEPDGEPDIGAIQVTDDGRIFGYLAPKNVAHRGRDDRRVTVPMRNVDYSTWMNRETIVAGGHRVAAGPITMDCGHATTARPISAQVALEHYDNSCSIVATARIGENSKGVWIAGALLPGVEPSQVARMLACQLSGDWRAHKEKRGYREFCGALLVPVPGFPVANRRMSLRMDGGQLVASAVPVRVGEHPEPTTRDTAVLTAAGILARSVGRDKPTRAAELAAIVKG